MSRILPLLRAALAAMLLVSLAAPAVAGGSDAPRSPLGTPLPAITQKATGDAATPREPPSTYQRLWNWVLAQQQHYTREMASAVKRMKSEGIVEATLTLAFIAFGYGVLHAAGPGHGKAIISSYVLANERTVRRGIMLSFLAALIQALSAITVVGVLAIALKATSLEIKAAEAWIETVSWGLVAVIGAWLVWRQVREILQARRAKAQAAESQAHAHAHDHAQEHDGHVHGPGCCGHDHGPEHHHHHHDHDHDHHDCGHAHAPDPRELEGKLSWTKALAIAFSVGIRPCTGAILVLVFALSQGILIAGVFATFAMALGTAITVSALAALAVGSRELATRLAGGRAGWVTAVGHTAGLVGSSLVLILGATLFIASLKGPAPL